MANDDMMGDDTLGDDMMSDDTLGDDMMSDDTMSDDMMSDDTMGDDMMSKEDEEIDINELLNELDELETLSKAKKESIAENIKVNA